MATESAWLTAVWIPYPCVKNPSGSGSRTVRGAFKREKLALSEGIVAGPPQIVASEPRVKAGSLPALIVLGKESSRALRYRNPQLTEGNLLVVVGSVLAVVGLADLALHWFPMQLEIEGWWLGTLSQSLANLPTSMIGLVLIAYGLLRRGTPAIVMRGVAAGFAALSVFLVAIGLLYIVAGRFGMTAASGGATRPTKAILMNSIEIVVYPIGLLGMAAILWYGVTSNSRRST